MRDLSDAHIRRCAWCGAAISPMAHGLRIYCSKQCGRASDQSLIAQARAEARAGRTCPQCGDTFDAVRSNQAFCSAVCRDRHRHRPLAQARRAARAGRTCRYCKTTFDAGRSDQVYCSAVCRDRHRNRRRSPTRDVAL